MSVQEMEVTESVSPDFVLQDIFWKNNDFLLVSKL